MTRTLLLLALALAACKPAPPEVAAAPQELAAPFDAAELRAGLPKGTQVLYRVTTQDGAVMYNLWEVTEADQQGLVVGSTLMDEERSALAPTASMARTWAAMVAESQPKEGDEVMAPARQQTALGVLRVTTIIVNDPQNDNIFEIRTYSLAHPGPLIKQESIMDGELMLRVEAIEWTVGPPP